MATSTQQARQRPRVAVLRALMLGDMLCATPALRALRMGWPQAHVTLVGLPWAREFALRLSSVDDFIELPGWPGLPERPPASPGARLRFLDQVQRRGFELAMQMHGSGHVVNALMAAFEARRNAGFRAHGAWFPEADAGRFIQWPTQGTEVERLLSLTRHLGMPDCGLGLEFPLRDADRAAARAAWPHLASGGYAIVHAGSQLPSRRWPPARFAALADTLADAGLTPVLTGLSGENELVASVAAAMRRVTRRRAVDLVGATSLWTLGALVERARLVVSNDTGISHVAAALGTPSLVLSCGGDAKRWAPADTQRHRVLAHELPCRPCAHTVCPVGHGCALALDVQQAQDALQALLNSEPVYA